MRPNRRAQRRRQPKVANRLDAALRDDERSIRWLSDRTGFDYDSCWKYVNGVRPVPEDRRAPIAEALGRDVSDLFD